MKQKYWTEKEVKYLEKNYKQKTTEELRVGLFKELKSERDKGSIISKLRALGFKLTKEIIAKRKKRVRIALIDKDNKFTKLLEFRKRYNKEFFDTLSQQELDYYLKKKGYQL